MKWTLISDASSTVQLFNLMEANTVKSIVRYSPSQQSARITCMEEQRLFFIEQSGYNSHHFVFKNEYGFTVGKLSVEDADTEAGTIEIDEKKFHYRQLVNTELVIYKHDHIMPLATCSFIKNQDSQKLFSHSNKKTIHQYCSLLLGLCCYLSHPGFSETTAVHKPSLSHI